MELHFKYYKKIQDCDAKIEKEREVCESRSHVAVSRFVCMRMLRCIRQMVPWLYVQIGITINEWEPGSESATQGHFKLSYADPRDSLRVWV